MITFELIFSLFRFGARTGMTNIFQGLVKMITSIVLGENLQILLTFFPTSILASLLLYAGLSLAHICTVVQTTSDNGVDREKEVKKSESENTVFLFTICGSLGLGTGWGFVIGMVVFVFCLPLESLQKYLNPQEWRMILCGDVSHENGGELGQTKDNENTQGGSVEMMEVTLETTKDVEDRENVPYEENKEEEGKQK
jgi:hypothetical protein